MGRTFKEASRRRCARSRSAATASRARSAADRGARTRARSSALIETKLRVPRPRAALVRRRGVPRGLLVGARPRAVRRFDPWFLREIARSVRAEDDGTASEFAPGRLDVQDERPARPCQGARLLGHAVPRAQLHGLADERSPRSGVRARRREGVRAGLQAGGHLRGRVRGLHAVPVLDLRRGGRGAAHSTSKKVMILGGGPNRIGQGIEFDYCCVHAVVRAARGRVRDHHGQLQPGDGLDRLRHSDRLYFEPLTLEDVLEICAARRSRIGAIVQFGGQTPLKLAARLAKAACRILGTSPDAIDLAEDRERFAKFIDEARAPAAGERRRPLARGGLHGRRAHRLPGDGAPELRARRPRDGGRLRRRAARALHARGGAGVARSKPVLIDRFLQDAIEVDVDCVCDGERRASSAA